MCACMQFLNYRDLLLQSQGDGPHAFLNGGSGPMSMMPHGYMPFVGSGLGPEVGPDMLGKMEAPSWDANGRMGLTDMQDKSQVSRLLPPMAEKSSNAVAPCGVALTTR